MGLRNSPGLFEDVLSWQIEWRRISLAKKCEDQSLVFFARMRCDPHGRLPPVDFGRPFGANAIRSIFPPVIHTADKIGLDPTGMQ
jgi:hypothetical protein